MLIEFRVSNHRSIKEEQVFTAAASGRLNDPEDDRPRKIADYDEPILPVIAIYGANASGKTNLLKAIDFMSEAVVHSHRLWEPDSGVPRNPFAWENARANESTFEVEFILNDCRYQYGFSVNGKCVLEEWLFSYPHGRKRVLFQREENNKFEFGESLEGHTKVIEEITGSNALYVSAASQHRHPQLFPIYSWFRSIYAFNLNLGRRGRPRGMRHRPKLYSILSGEHEELVPESEQILAQFLKLLKASDFGVDDVRLDKASSERPHTEYYLRHAVDDDDPWLPLYDESNGTQTMFRLGIPVIQALSDGTILVVDELESSLHPLLAIELVNLFNNPRSNPKNAQLFFTTHDSNLLGTTIGEPVVRRDQVYLTEKDKTGATVIYPLTDYKPRKSENLERGYLQGRYGAIPFLGQFSMVGSE